MWYTSRSYDETVKEGSFGMTLPDFTPKPAYYAFSNWIVQAGQICPPVGLIKLLSITRTSPNAARVEFMAPTGFVYTLQSSSNLSLWFPAATNITSTNDIFAADDVQSADSALRFYRVLWTR